MNGSRKGPGGRLAALVSGRRTKWVVLAFWIVLLVALGPLSGRLKDVQKNDAASWLPAGAQSTQVVKLDERFHSGEPVTAVVVYERAGGITPADQAKARSDAAAFARLPGAGQAQGPFRSTDGKALRTLVPVNKDDAQKAVTSARDIAARGADGLETHVTGPAGGAADLSAVFGSMDGLLLMVAAGVVIALLLLIYRSPLLWLVPVLSAVFALGLSQSAVYLLAKYAGLTFNGQTSGILTVLVFGVATDYALLLVARYREELRRHEDRHEAMAAALHRAGPAVLASAGTVAVGLLCLLAATMNSNRGLGPVAAAGVIAALAAMMTLLPALLVVLGRWIFWPLVPRYDAATRLEGEHGLWGRVGRLVAARPRLLWIGTSVVLLALTFGLGSLSANGLSNKGQFVTKPDSVTGAEALARHFPAGSGAPAVVIGDASRAAGLATTLRSTEGVAEVGRPTSAQGLVRYEATLRDPADSRAAQNTVDRLRKAVGSTAQVGGTTAVNLDTRRAAAHDNKVIIPVVLAVVFLILAVLLRALVAPLLMMATVVLSFLASLGVSALVFKHGFGFDGSDASFPLLAFIFLVALGVDYNIFLMHRVREEAERSGTRRGVVRGLTVTGGVITSAGLVLAATFAVLTALPLAAMVQMGFAVAFGVLLDTVVVRSLLLPALAFDLGRRIWLPGRLARPAAPAPERAGELEPLG
ncbi:MMPL family transporter [Actinomadura rupiterrae]|uniref:MMPL family transporter n=1 Tax=Actinomadura rupiterrae TaxID=559627 RepID=UPI0020A2955B|nr:MMPL family transporter [Actinomadura rupiterrae]MCP2341049.1 RND superfamily putative drug exporter [Actinomadura rupiterrae]